jgi:hypothetical protein
MTELDRLIFDRTLNRLRNEKIRLIKEYNDETKPHKRTACMDHLIAFHESWVKNITLKIDKMYTRATPDMFADVDELAYRQPWGRMPETHRGIKLRQYITTLGYDKKETNRIAESIFDLLKRKKLRVKDIIYDANIMKVTSVDNLPKGILNEESDSENDSSTDEDSDSDNKDDSSSEE